MSLLAALALLLIAALVLGSLAGLLLRRAHETGETARLRESIADLEHELGKTFRPVIERFANQLTRWLDR